MKLQQLENEYSAKLRAERLRPSQGLEERMALYRQEIEEQAKTDVARQVERIREIEVAAARLEEGARWRRALEGERQELERLHSERLSKLRAREEEMSDKLKRQQREVEAVAFEHRQRIMREEERLRAWRVEAQSALDGREDTLKHRERALELRERAVQAREAGAEKRVAEAAEAVANAQVTARAEVEKEYLELKANLSAQRLQLEMDRGRIVEIRTEAAAEVAAARSKEDRLRALETARAEAEARAAAHAAEAEVTRLQVERLQFELATVRDELSRRVAAAAESADAMLSNAAGALNMLEAETHAARGSTAALRAAHAELAGLKQDLEKEAAARQAVEKERDKARDKLGAAQAQVQSLAQRLAGMEALIEEALAAREEPLRQLEDANFTAAQLQRELGETKVALSRAREEAMALRVYGAAAGTPGGAGGLSRGMAGGATPMGRPLTRASSALLSGFGGAAGGPGGTNTYTHHPMAASIDVPQAGGLSPRGLRSSYAPSSAAAAAPPLSPRALASAAAAAGTAGLRPYTPATSVAAASLATTAGAATGVGLSQSMASWPVGVSGVMGGSFSSSITAAPPAPTGPAVPSLPLAAVREEGGKGAAGRPKSPVQERLDELSRQEKDMADELTGFRRRVAEQREASTRELALVMQRVQQASAPSSKRTSHTGEGGEDIEASLRRSASSFALRTAMSTAGLNLNPPGSPRSERIVPLPVPLPSSLQPQYSLSSQPSYSSLSGLSGAGAQQASFDTGQLLRSADGGYPAIPTLSGAPQSRPVPPVLDVPLPAVQQYVPGPAASVPAAAQGGVAGWLASSSAVAMPAAAVTPAPAAAVTGPVAGYQPPGDRPMRASDNPSLSFSDIPAPLAHSTPQHGRRSGGGPHPDAAQAAQAGYGSRGGAAATAAAAAGSGSLPPLPGSRNASAGGAPQPAAVTAAPAVTAFQPATTSLAPLAAPPPPAPAAHIIPGLVIVSDLSAAASQRTSTTGAAGGEEASSANASGGGARNSIGGGAAASMAAAAMSTQEPARQYARQPSLEDVRRAQAEKLRLLQEQQDARLAAQRSDEERRRREEAEEEERRKAAAAAARYRGADDDDDEEYADDFGSPESVASGTGESDTPAGGNAGGAGGRFSSTGDGYGSLGSAAAGAALLRTTRSVSAASDTSSGAGLEAPALHKGGGGARLAGLEEDGESTAGSAAHGGGAHHDDDGDDEDDAYSESLPGDLGGGLSVGEDSGLVAGLDDGSDSDAGLGGVAAGGSSGSVF